MFEGRGANELGRELMASLHQCENPLSRAFFSAQNIATIQASLKKVIRGKTGYEIGNQSDEQLGIVMRAAYVLHAEHRQPVDQEVPRLNRIVLSDIAPMVATGISQYLGYVKDASRLPTPMERSKNMSIKGRNTFELFRGV
jgi:Family of unknown function (DUF5761)